MVCVNQAAIHRTNYLMKMNKLDRRSHAALVGLVLLLQGASAVAGGDASSTMEINARGETVLPKNENGMEQNTVSETVVTEATAKSCNVSQLEPNAQVQADEEEEEEEEYYDDEEYDEYDDEYDDDYYDEEEDEEYDDEYDDDKYGYDEDYEDEDIDLGPGSLFGAVQTVEDGITDKERADFAERLKDTEYYMKYIIWADEFYEPVQDLCFNEYPLCTQWAIQGYCDGPDEQDENPDWMVQQCAPACHTCEILHYDTRCAADPDDPVAWQPGDLNKMFERIVNQYGDDAIVYSRPDYLPGHDEETAPYEIGPWIISMEDFLSEEEAERFIHQGSTLGYERSYETGEIDEETGEPDDGVVSDERRTSTNAWCHHKCQEDPIIANVTQRIEDLTGIPFENSEDIQLLKYEKGEFYVTHTDLAEHEIHARQGPRILTVYMYLNDMEEGAGGETRFDWFDLTVRPKRGRVVLWPSVLDEDPLEMEERTEHEAMPVLKGQKFGANAWLHLRSFRLRDEYNC